MLLDCHVVLSQHFLVPYTVVLGGRDYFKNMAFGSRDEYSEWQGRVDEIKETIARINEDNPQDTAIVPLPPERHRQKHAIACRVW